MEEEEIALRKEFVSGIIRSGEALSFSSSEVLCLVISNICIPEIDIDKANIPTRVFAVNGSDRMLLGTLVPGLHEMDAVNYKVPPLGKVDIEILGPHPVHVIGYRQPLPFESDSDLSRVSREEEEEESAKE